MKFNSTFSNISYRLIQKLKYSDITFLNFLLYGLLWLGSFYPQFTLSPSHFPDTPGYIPSPKQLEGYFSLTGEAQRGWPTVIAYWLMNSDWQRTFLQSVLYALGWSFLIFAWLKGKSQIHKLTVGGLLVLLALTPRNLQWNMFLLSESISVFLILLGMASMKLSLQKYSNNLVKIEKKNIFWFIIGTISFSLAVVNRASLVLILLISPLIIFGFFIANRNRVKYAAIGLMISSTALIYPIQYNAKTNHFWSSNETRLSRSSFYFIYNTIEGSLQPEWGDMLWEYTSDRAPKCLEDYRASGKDPFKNPYYLSDIMPANCPQAIYWLNENYESEFFKFVLYHPISLLSYSADMINYVQDQTNYASNTIIPQSAVKIFESSYENNYSYRPIIGWISLAFILASAFIFFRKRPTSSSLLAICFLIFGITSVSITQLIIVSEPVRITTPATVMLIVSCILVISESVPQFLSTKFLNRL